MVFSQLDVVHLLAWAFWFYFHVEHQSPWGLWTTSARQRYRARRRAVGGVGPTGPAYGVLWLVMPLLVVAATFYFFREFETASQGLYIGNFVVIIITSVLVKVWRPLFFDYSDSRAAAWVGAGALLGNVANCVIVGVATAWVSLGLYAAHALWLAYLLYVSVVWQNRFGLNRAQSRMVLVKNLVN